MSDPSREILREAFEEILDNQLAQNDPPETRRTYERLLAEGYTKTEARNLIMRVIVVEVYETATKMRRFDREKFVRLLHGLPGNLEELDEL